MSLFGSIPTGDDRVRPEIKTLIARGNITLAEYREIRCNSYEHQALVPALNDEAFVVAMQHALDNCSTNERPFSTYDKAVVGLYTPELIRRFRAQLNNEQLIQACKNVGFDLTCGGCAERFYTGSRMHAHDESCATHVGGDPEQIRHLREALAPFVRAGDTFITGDMSSGEECVHASEEDVKRAIVALRDTEPPPAYFAHIFFGPEDGFRPLYERNPDGNINNCALANGDEQKNCQVCKEQCPDRGRFK